MGLHMFGSFATVFNTFGFMSYILKYLHIIRMILFHTYVDPKYKFEADVVFPDETETYVPPEEILPPPKIVMTAAQVNSGQEKPDSLEASDGNRGKNKQNHRRRRRPNAALYNKLVDTDTITYFDDNTNLITNVWFDVKETGLITRLNAGKIKWVIKDKHGNDLVRKDDFDDDNNDDNQPRQFYKNAQHDQTDDRRRPDDSGYVPQGMNITFIELFDEEVLTYDEKGVPLQDLLPFPKIGSTLEAREQPPSKRVTPAPAAKAALPPPEKKVLPAPAQKPVTEALAPVQSAPKVILKRETPIVKRTILDVPEDALTAAPAQALEAKKPPVKKADAENPKAKMPRLRNARVRNQQQREKPILESNVENSTLAKIQNASSKLKPMPVPNQSQDEVEAVYSAKAEADKPKISWADQVEQEQDDEEIPQLELVTKDSTLENEKKKFIPFTEQFPSYELALTAFLDTQRQLVSGQNSKGEKLDEDNLKRKLGFLRGLAKAYPKLKEQMAESLGGKSPLPQPRAPQIKVGPVAPPPAFASFNASDALKEEKPFYKEESIKKNLIIDVEKVKAALRVVDYENEQQQGNALIHGGCLYTNQHFSKHPCQVRPVITYGPDGKPTGDSIKKPKIDWSKATPTKHKDLVKFASDSFGNFKTRGSINVGPVTPGSHIILFTLCNDGGIQQSNGTVTDYDNKEGTFGFSATTIPGNCGGVYIHADTGRIIGTHYLGHEHKPNRGIEFPKN
jgi:hypothetical protein